jgi:membrane protein
VESGFVRWRRVLWQTFSSWNGHRSLTESAALAFYMLFSLAPILIVTIAIAGALFGADAVRGQVVREIAGLMGRAQADMIETILKNAAADRSRGLAALLGGVVVLFGASAVFVQLQSSLNRVWEVAPRPGRLIRSLFRKRIASFAMLLGIGFLLVVSLAVSAATAALQDWAIARFASVSPAIFRALNFAGTLLLFTLLFAMIYRILPDREIAWRDVWLGAAAAALLFEVGKWAFALYIGRTAAASAYGAAGALVVILLWVYYTTSLLLLGAEFTRAHSKVVLGSRPETTPGAKRVKQVEEGSAGTA